MTLCAPQRNIHDSHAEDPPTTRRYALRLRPLFLVWRALPYQETTTPASSLVGMLKDQVGLIRKYFYGSGGSIDTDTLTVAETGSGVLSVYYAGNTEFSRHD